MKVLLRQRGVAGECLGHIRHNKYEYIHYYLIQGPTELSSYSYYNKKEDFVRFLIVSDFSVSLDVNKIDLSNRYSWVREDEIMLLNDTLMETKLINKNGNIIEHRATTEDYQIWEVINPEKRKIVNGILCYCGYSGSALNFTYETNKFNENKRYVINPNIEDWKPCNNSLMETE